MEILQEWGEGVCGWDGDKYNVRHFSRQFWRATDFNIYTNSDIQIIFFKKSKYINDMKAMQCKKRSFTSEYAWENLITVRFLWIPSPVSVTSPYEWYILKKYIKQQLLYTINHILNVTANIHNSWTCPFFSGKAKFNK